MFGKLLASTQKRREKNVMNSAEKRKNNSRKATNKMFRNSLAPSSLMSSTQQRPWA